jgi:hypothetical protein
VAVITKLVKGYDVNYPFMQQGRWSGDYFDVKGEPRGRWWGSGAAALGLAPGSSQAHRAGAMPALPPGLSGLAAAAVGSTGRGS